jgi:hypothetical protein
MTNWQPQHDPRRAGQRPPATPPQWGQGTPPQWQDGTQARHPGYGQPEAWQPDAYSQPQWQPRDALAPQYRVPARPAARRAKGGGYGPWIALGAVVLVAVAGGAFYVLHGRTATPSAATAAPAEQAAAQPETEAGVRSAATAFYALYSAGQWPQAWTGLSPATQKAVPQDTWDAVHQQCTSKTAGMARVIKSVTMAGATAVVTETVAGALGGLGSVTDAWSYSGGRWGLTLPASSTAIFTQGSVKADVAASKADGDCVS